MNRIFTLLAACLFILTNAPAKIWAQDTYPDVYQVIACGDSSFIDIFAGHPQEDEIKELDLAGFSVTSTKGARAYFNESRVLVYFHEEINAPDQISYTVDGSGLGTITKDLFVVECPDNIGMAVCVDKPVGFTYTLQEAWRSTQANVSTCTSPIIGDLNGDGFSEIVVAKSTRSNPVIQNLYVYDGKDRSMIEILTPLGNCYLAGPIGMARVNGIPLIVFIGADGYLYAYNPYDLKGNTSISTNYYWRSDAQITNGFTSANTFGSVAFADFNNDGVAEVYAGNRIFNAATGKLLLETPAVGRSVGIGGIAYHYMPAVADLDGDRTLEYIGGTKIYKINITNPGGTDGNVVSEYYNQGAITISGTPKTVTDGITMLADFNKDGYLDVVLFSHNSRTTIAIAVWDIKNKKVLGSVEFGSGANDVGGIPFIGDVDADGKLEIMVSTYNKVSGFRWNGTDNSMLTNAYNLDVTDLSGSTGITLFDFNQSGQPQLVYQDEVSLRILKAEGNTFTDLYKEGGNNGVQNVHSGTYVESAVVADVDNDGAAEIITVGGTTRNTVIGTLRIYKSGNEFSWAPARKVWNQYSYNVVNINDDLTVPRYRMNQARIFSYNTNGTPHQPFNNSLQQQTVLDESGNPFRPLPYAVWESQPVYTRVNNEITVTASIANRGDVDLNTPIIIVAYKEEIASANKIGAYEYRELVRPDEVKEITATFPLDDDDSTSKIVITVNDDGSGNAEQDQCNVVSQNIIYFVNALDDPLIKEGPPAEVTIDIAANDYLGKHPDEDRDITLDDNFHSIVLAGSGGYAGTEPLYGTIRLEGGKVIYTPDDPETFPGRDVFTYRLTVDDNVIALSSEATVIIEFIKAESNSYTLSDYGKVEIDLTGNDHLLENSENDPLRAVTVILPDEDNELQAPALGTVAFDPEDETKIIYIPGRRDGLDSFEYQIAYANPNADSEDESTLYITSTATVYVWVLNEDRITCNEKESITLEVPDGAVFTWYDTETGGNMLPTEGDNATLVVEKSGDAVSKEQWLEISYAPDGENELFEDERFRVRVRFQPVHMYWNQSASNKDWNDVANWTDEEGTAFDPGLGFIPSECTIVHIPGNAASYPVLDEANTPRAIYGNPTCDRIIFHFGGEVARPELLTYNKAFVHYNVGYYNDGNLENADPLSAEPMKRDRWYALASPLKRVATGDFSFGGRPNIWQMSFVRNTGSSSDWIGEFSVPFNTNSVELGNSAAYSLAFWANGYSTDRGSSNQSGLDAVKGIIELPYYENETVSDAHRIHSYNPGSKISSFRYYYWQIDGLPLAPAEEKPFGTIDRGSNNEAYRFVIDGNVDASGVFNINSVPASREVMIGNPVMSTLDFDELYAANTTRMENYYRIFNGSTFDTYRVGLGGDGIDKHIAPLQAFFITTKLSGTIQLQFPLDKVSVTNPGTGGKLKSSTAGNGDVKPDVLHVTSESGEGTSSATLAFLDAGEENVPALFYPDAPDVAQIYFIGGSDERNVIQYASYGEKVWLGYHMENSGKVTLYFKNPENVNTASLILTDQWTGKEQDLLTDPVYTIESTSSSFTDRFLLKVGERTDSPTGNDVVDDWDIRVYTQNDHFIVRSNLSIDKVQVYDLQGVVRSVRENINSDYYAYPLSGHGMSIVKITAVDGREKVTKVVF